VRIAWLTLPLLPAVALIGAEVPWLSGSFEGGWNLRALVYAFWEPFVAWGFILGLLSFFQRRFARLTARRSY
jgi:hypothetical protein